MERNDGRLIAVDWGTSRMRAALVGSGAQVLDRTSSDSGIQNVQPGGFPAALDAATARWQSGARPLPVVMAGMVGSRNGWVEAPYAVLPCSIADLATATVDIAASAHPITIVPGVDCPSSDGSYDVMRGEETQAFGTGVDDGLICLPGTHSKWVKIEGGRIVRFVTFMTGELYAALIQSFVGKLAEQPEDRDGGDAMAARFCDLAGGLPRALFQARTQVLRGTMPGTAVRPFLSSLLIGAEVQGALAAFGGMSHVHLVAADPQRTTYESSLRRQGVTVVPIDPETATLNGLLAIATARGLYDAKDKVER